MQHSIPHASMLDASPWTKHLLY